MFYLKNVRYIPKKDGKVEMCNQVITLSKKHID